MHFQKGIIHNDIGVFQNYKYLHLYFKGAVKLKSRQNELKRNSLPNEGTANQEVNSK